MDIFYRISESGEYILVYDNDETNIGPEVAIAFSLSKDEERGISTTLHKHGSPEKVEEWFTKAIKAYSSADDPFVNQMASELKVIQGKIPIDELNKIIDITGYLGVYLNRVNK